MAVESAQDTSRMLAPLASGRDQLMRVYTSDRALADIAGLMESAT